MPGVTAGAWMGGGGVGVGGGGSSSSEIRTGSSWSEGGCGRRGFFGRGSGSWSEGRGRFTMTGDFGEGGDGSGRESLKF